MTDYSKLKVSELKELLKERSIPPTGLARKQQIIDALEANDADAGSNVDDVQLDALSKPKKRALSPSTVDGGPNKQPKKTKTVAASPRSPSPSPPPTPAPASGESKVKVDNAQIATSSALHIPVDEGCPLSSYNVHVDSGSGIIYDASLNQTNASNNNNKFYRVQVRNNHPMIPSSIASKICTDACLSRFSRGQTVITKRGLDGVVLVSMAKV